MNANAAQAYHTVVRVSIASHFNFFKKRDDMEVVPTIPRPG